MIDLSALLCAFRGCIGICHGSALVLRWRACLWRIGRSGIFAWSRIFGGRHITWKSFIGLPRTTLCHQAWWVWAGCFSWKAADQYVLRRTCGTDGGNRSGSSGALSWWYSKASKGVDGWCGDGVLEARASVNVQGRVRG
jgi:hypothetical protein